MHCVFFCDGLEIGERSGTRALGRLGQIWGIIKYWIYCRVDPFLIGFATYPTNYNGKLINQCMPQQTSMSVHCAWIRKWLIDRTVNRQAVALCTLVGPGYIRTMAHGILCMCCNSCFSFQTNNFQPQFEIIWELQYIISLCFNGDRTTYYFFTFQIAVPVDWSANLLECYFIDISQFVLEMVDMSHPSSSIHVNM